LLTGKRRLPGFATKPGYKQTEVGLIPEDWEVTTVGNEFSIQLGKMLDSEKNVGVPKPYLLKSDRLSDPERPDSLCGRPSRASSR
jgi:type I restriction enzyme S subunit